MTIKAFKGNILHFPRQTLQPDRDYQYYQDGMLVTRNGRIIELGYASVMCTKYPDAAVMDYTGKLIIPGLIDSHLHFPQTEMIARYGEQLLQWLENYTFPTEAKFSDPEYSAHIANVFVNQLLRNGTTSAMVYSTVHKSSTDALFTAASSKNMLMIAGKVCMDRNCPPELQDSAASAQRDSADLIDKWHGKQRQFYALTPRFAPTSSAAQMEALGELAVQYPDVFIQTHLSENKSEIEWVKSLYPGFKHYLDVYDRHHMVRKGAVFGHCLHLENEEWQRLTETGASIAFCPTSNLFLGSGLFDLEQAMRHKTNVMLATDVGAGTSFSMLKTMGEAYKVCQLQHTRLSPLHGLYLMTQGSSVSLGLSHLIGNLNPKSDADFVVLDPHFDPLTTLRLSDSDKDPEDIIFALSMLGDDRAVVATWIAGKNVYNGRETEHGLV